ncbi:MULTISPECIES: acetyl-CoA carboxylase biotin carboxylase subunit [Bradyrhizobium]|jgi:acetyl-CoA carboxylase, biotin carboxylase subunit|uniref:acetyl-CoA carboxylase biotin carboxylase subunit n=1 Tax=Bradyrhizobium TaxID=374 RepID=UPI000483CDED|nr:MULTISPECIES: acetyl-CoA carboxylase biotin carboxylase subunit [Bradyrhizobium]MCS3448396.1 acetyl-CoA carboxylase biotin carboxylase subunit [Bradyrhizobium elkanii]MCS3560465.1 acetyl-CoA carboxylase biotin carboxylase subunit [Bradyrhizobium elkanii]MCW2149692.1 acetyl-CoA carboxylase biotin carboxylase subunit [Bradyrhizobium elkanii]MCW2360341.1 acetyl-CoA carboxylase biotin carboxylase subunit [Bradyrhizobium elkanii]MCW2373421.1 acetyl-CoA carboxylase biotin carboxylase subunit [Bra
MAIKKLLIANRGEIAVRIIRAARDLGIATVQVYSKADQDSLAVRLADEAVDIGPPQASKSYLNQAAILAAARSAGADAIHPGYGFLAENAEFAAAVEAAGLIFVGPTAQSIRLMGDKVAAREAAAAAGVPTVPGSQGRLESAEAAFALVEKTGFPVMIKAAAGGGGRGIRIARSHEEFQHLMPQAQAEALAAFGDGGLYVEKLIEGARHIEVQVLGDGHDVIHCFERECSLQRRRQKVWEEAPSPSLTQAVRERLCTSAVALAKAVNYRGAGTLEYLYDDATGEFYFLEMNTRIQVEHPVTEMITGIDLVREMIQIAGGERLRISQNEMRVSGHSIEVRINAEDPARNFLPNPGTVSALSLPVGDGVRFDSMLYQGYTVPPFYDSLLGKLIVHDKDRPSAMKKLEHALAELSVEGIFTTKPLHQALARDADVQAGRFHTAWLEPWLESHAAALATAQPLSPAKVAS